ncbi:hypothetical protein PG987_006558 [Apiospora arundinis]
MAHSSFEDLPSEIKLQILGHCTRYTLPTLIGASPTTLRLYRRYRRSVMGDIAQRASLGIYDSPGSSFEDEGGPPAQPGRPLERGRRLLVLRRWMITMQHDKHGLSKEQCSDVTSGLIRRAIRMTKQRIQEEGKKALEEEEAAAQASPVETNEP